MKQYLLSGVLACLFSLFPFFLKAQHTTIKTNMLYWATATPNLGFETALGKKTTLELSGGYNPFRLSDRETNRKITHWIIMPEIRRWMYGSYDGHFFGFHGLFGRYNMGHINLPFGLFGGLKENRYEGYAAGGGFSYGYQWYLGTRWNLEAQVGLGYAYFNYDRYECKHCGEFLEKKHKHYFGPTRIGISLIYLIK